MSSTMPDMPLLESDYALSPEQIVSYQRDGHLLLRGVCSPEETTAYRPAIVEATYRHNWWETRKLEDRDTYGKAFFKTGNLWLKDEIACRFVLARRFAKIAADLMGVEAVRIYHDQAILKEAGGGHTPWHQDHYYWPLDTTNTITMWMPLVDVSAEMGTMIFATGSHKHGLLGHLIISDESEATFSQYIQEHGLTCAPAGAMAAGDATFHSGLMLHSAPGNPTDRCREVMAVIYFEDGVRLLEPDNPARESDRQGFFPDVKPGELCASDVTPVVYRRPQK
jgi:hypothetical protein